MSEQCKFVQGGGYNPWASDAKIYPVKTVKADSSLDLSTYPSMMANGSVKGMKKLYWGKGALCVKKGNYIYNVSGNPDLYFQINVV